MKNPNMALLALLFTISFLPLHSQDTQSNKLKESAEVISELSQVKEQLPAKLFAMSEGVIIIPKMINAGLGVAGKRGKGVAMVKQEDDSWSKPVFVSITGGNIGFQAGVQAVDLVLVVKNRKTLTNMKKNSFNLGGDVSVTAGPLGRNSTANTDASFEAEIYSYSKSKGLFAGISLSGSVLDIDEKTNRTFYGSTFDRADLFSKSQTEFAEVTALQQTLATLFQ